MNPSRCVPALPHGPTKVHLLLSGSIPVAQNLIDVHYVPTDTFSSCPSLRLHPHGPKSDRRSSQHRHPSSRHLRNSGAKTEISTQIGDGRNDRRALSARIQSPSRLSEHQGGLGWRDGLVGWIERWLGWVTGLVDGLAGVIDRLGGWDGWWVLIDRLIGWLE